MQLLDGKVISRPIAGTRRGADRRGRPPPGAELLSEHPKERAEHVMLVDLARNDVGRVVEFGTEQVDELMTLERYSHVMHLTSQVSGELGAGQGPVDVLRATFPAGTVSGAPRCGPWRSSTSSSRPSAGPYAGVVGYFDFSGNLDTAIAIRTMVWRDGRAACRRVPGSWPTPIADGGPGMPQQGARRCSRRQRRAPGRLAALLDALDDRAMSARWPA